MEKTRTVIMLSTAVYVIRIAFSTHGQPYFSNFDFERESSAGKIDNLGRLDRFAVSGLNNSHRRNMGKIGDHDLVTLIHHYPMIGYASEVKKWEETATTSESNRRAPPPSLHRYPLGHLDAASVVVNESMSELYKVIPGVIFVLCPCLLPFATVK